MNPSHLSCTTVTFGGRLPQKLEAMRQAGFAATELWPRDYYEDNGGPEVAIDLLRQSGLAPSAYQNLRNFEGMPREKRARKIEIASQLFSQMRLLGCQTLVLCSNIEADSSGDSGQIADDLRMLGDLAAANDVRVAWEPICWGRWIRDYRDAWRIVQAVNHSHIGLTLDSFHVCALELPLEPIADIAADKLFLVEVADLPGGRFDHIEMSRAYRLFPGEGITPIRGFLDQVERTGYQGIVSVEVFNAYYLTLPPEQVAQRAMQSLRSLW